VNLDCQRWARLADLEAAGEPTPSDGRTFQRGHEAICAECAREAAMWRALRVAEVQAPIDDAEVDGILALATAARSRRASLARRWSGAFLVGAAACAAAAVAVVWFGGRFPGARLAEKDGPGQRQAPVVARQAAPLTSTRGAPEQAPRGAPEQAPRGAPEQAAETSLTSQCSEMVPGALVCLGGGAILGRRVLSGPARELEVTRGRVVVSLSPQPAGTSFSLATTSGRVVAVGTIFSVDVSTDGSTVARVVEGKVLAYAGAENSAQPIHFGQALRLGERQPRALSALEREADLALLAPSGVNDRGASPESSPSKSPSPSSDSTGSRETLEYARSLRASGDLRRAVEVYRKIHAESPRSASGRTALVSLGELLLSLHDAQAALNAFDSYLAGGGALAQEAMFGRARALRALNRPAEERAAISRFLAAYPEAPQGRVLRSRLSAIQK
jgi:TolA-binding protein